MYILEVNHGGGEIHRHFLLPGQTYTLGRKECRILLPAAEPSISRHHATIVVAPMPRYSVLDPAAQLEIRIEDVSKHGTFVDRERIGKDNTRFLYPEDRIRLGLRVTARIIPMVLVLGISPDLTDENLDLVLDSAVHIGALVVEDVIPAPLQYYERHTNCVGFLYVSEDAFAMEETMMQALGYGYTLVTPAYIQHLVKALEERDTLMPSEFPTPSSPSPASMGLRAVHYRRPAQTFFSVTEFLSVGRPIVASVFEHYTFLILDDAIRDTYSAVLELFGGKVEALTADTIPQWRTTHPQTGAYPLTTCVLVAEDDFRAVSEEVMERGSGRGDFNVHHTHPVITGYLRLYKLGVCLIPEENVHLSLYRNDGNELTTKATACYLQRTSEDVLADPAGGSATPTPTPTAAPIAAAATSKSHDSLTSPTEAAAPPAPPPPPAAATVAGRRSSGPTRSAESPLTSPPSQPGITHLVPVQSRRSRESSYVSAPSANRTESTEKTSASPAAVPHSPSNPSVAVAVQPTAPSSSPRANSPEQTSATQSLQSISVADTSAQPSAALSTTAAPAEGPSAPAPAGAPFAAAAPPPTEDTEKLTSNAIAPTALNLNGSGSFTSAAESSSLNTSVTLKPAPAAVPQPVAAAPKSATSSTAEANNTTAAPAPAGDDTAAAAMTREVSDSAASAPRGRLVGPRASHPFSLGLRARNSSANNSSSDSGDDEAATSPAPNAVTDSSGRPAQNGVETEEDASAAAGPTRRASASAQRRASISGRRPSLGSQPSPVILPLKSEEVVRPRTRTTSGSQPSAYAAAVAALGRRSTGPSEDRPPLAPSEEPPTIASLEDAQRRSSGSADLASHGMPPLPPSAGAPAGTASTSAAPTAPLLHRAASKTSAGSSAGATAASSKAGGVSSSSSAASGTNNGAGAATGHASVRRGEQRLASASVPTPRRSLVRVNPSLASVAHERSMSPQQQTRTKLKRFTTPERDVVVHNATQVSKSPPRQRVEAVRIANAPAERRMSVSREPEMSLPRHSDAAAESDGAATGSMGNRRSVLRRESVSRGGPVGGPVTRRASSSFQRSDSAQLREMATPHRLTTTRISSSVPRTRRAKAYGSVQRQRSPEPGSEETSMVMEAETPTSSVLTTPGPLASQRASIRRRRGSPSHGTGATAATAAAGTAMPGQIPGLRGSSAAPVLGGTGNATAETYFRLNDELNTHCQKFMKEFVDNFMTETEHVTRAVVRQTYMDTASKDTLENGVERILEFLQYVNTTEPDIPSMYSTSNTRAACHQVRQKSQYALSKIKACYKTVNCKIPTSLTRARAALSTRNVSPPQRRLNSVSGGMDTAAARRQSTF